MKRRQRTLAILLSLVVMASYSVPALAMETASGNSGTAASTKTAQEASSETSKTITSEGEKDTASDTAESKTSEGSDASSESSEASGDSADAQTDSQVASDHTHQWEQVTEAEETWDGNTLVTPQVTAQECSVCGATKFESRVISASASVDGGVYWTATAAGSMEIYRGLGGDGKMPENPSWQVKTEWFDYTKNLKKVEVQSTVTSVSPEAFYGCENLIPSPFGKGLRKSDAAHSANALSCPRLTSRRGLPQFPSPALTAAAL